MYSHPMLIFSNGVFTKNIKCLTDPTLLVLLFWSYAKRSARNACRLFSGGGARHPPFAEFASAPHTDLRPFMTRHICDNVKLIIQKIRNDFGQLVTCRYQMRCLQPNNLNNAWCSVKFGATANRTDRTIQTAIQCNTI